MKPNYYLRLTLTILALFWVGYLVFKAQLWSQVKTPTPATAPVPMGQVSASKSAPVVVLAPPSQIASTNSVTVPAVNTPVAGPTPIAPNWTVTPSGTAPALPTVSGTMSGTTVSGTLLPSGGTPGSSAEEALNRPVDPPEELSWMTPTQTKPALPLTPKQAMDLALQNNPLLSAAKDQVMEKQQQKNINLSTLLPQIHTGPDYTQVNSNQGNITHQIFPVNRTALDTTVNLVLYNDQLISNLITAGYLYEAQQYIYEGTKLQTINDTGLAYYTYQQLKDSYHINLENLRFTQSVLSETLDRNKAGEVGDEEVYRWQAEEANDKTEVLSAYVNMSNALISLNQELGVEISSNWNISANENLSPDEYFFLKPEILAFFHNNKGNICTRFATFFALEHTPALHAADKAIKAQSVQLGAAQRSLYMPVITASGTYSYIIGESQIQEPNQTRSTTDWSVYVAANFPLYEGGKPISEGKLNQALLSELWADRKNLCLNIESLADQSLYTMQGTWPALKYTAFEVEKTRLSLEIFKNKYNQGEVTQTTLIDAENSYFQAQLTESQAKSTFLKNMIRFQLALGWFETFQSNDDKQRFLKSIKYFSRYQTDTPPPDAPEPPPSIPAPTSGSTASTKGGPLTHKSLRVGPALPAPVQDQQPAKPNSTLEPANQR